MVTIRVVFTSGQSEIIKTNQGETIRDALLVNGINPHGKWAKRLNCGGNGLCATCGIKLLSNPIDANHLHDKLAHRYGYLRLSCQLTVETDMVILVDDNKSLWGKKSNEYPT